jgi:hypothetical protein
VKSSYGVRIKLSVIKEILIKFVLKVPHYIKYLSEVCKEIVKKYEKFLVCKRLSIITEIIVKFVLCSSNIMLQSSYETL